MTRLSKKRLIQWALHDALKWQEGLADAWQNGTPERKEALALAKAYRELLRKDYGTDRTHLDTMVDGAETITLEEFSRRLKEPKA